MPVSPLYPLETDPTTGEPFLRVPTPWNNIIITPIRSTDVDTYFTHLNDMRVTGNLLTPYPYLRADAEAMVAREVATADALISRLKNAQHEDPSFTNLMFTGYCPVRCIREVQDNGSDLFIGDFRFVRYNWGEILDPNEKEAKVAENEARDVGDPGIVWMIGDFLVPSYSGRGIMTTVLRSVIDNWAVPRMNVHKIRLTAGTNNPGSIRVFEKLGFRTLHVVEGCYDLAESKGGPGKIDVRVLEWTR